MLLCVLSLSSSGRRQTTITSEIKTTEFGSFTGQLHIILYEYYWQTQIYKFWPHEENRIHPSKQSADSRPLNSSTNEPILIGISLAWAKTYLNFWATSLIFTWMATSGRKITQERRIGNNAHLLSAYCYSRHSSELLVWDFWFSANRNSSRRPRVGVMRPTVEQGFEQSFWNYMPLYDAQTCLLKTS